jgi:hypothetical protein
MSCSSQSWDHHYHPEQYNILENIYSNISNFHIGFVSTYVPKSKFLGEIVNTFIAVRETSKVKYLNVGSINYLNVASFVPKKIKVHAHHLYLQAIL